MDKLLKVNDKVFHVPSGQWGKVHVVHPVSKGFDRSYRIILEDGTVFDFLQDNDFMPEAGGKFLTQKRKQEQVREGVRK